MRNNRRVRVARALAPALLLAVTACGSGDAKEKDAPVSVSTPGVGDADEQYVDVPGEPMAAPKQGLRADDGSAWRFDDVPEGRLELLYFGYTRCPDVCPTTMADTAAALKKLPKDVAAKIDVTMVTTDPPRDTPKQLRTWLDGFDPSFQGVTGPIDDIIAAAKAYGITIDAPKKKAGNYEVVHGAQLLVLEPGGGAVGYFRDLTPAAELAERLPELVKNHAT